MAPLFAGKLLQWDVAVQSLLAFVAFSCTASVVYIINDIADREKDRQHPVKCHRPIASGDLSVVSALLGACVLLCIVAYISYQLNMELGAILLAYFVMNLAYSFRLKHVVIVDVLIIAMGFVLRAFSDYYATVLVPHVVLLRPKTLTT